MFTLISLWLRGNWAPPIFHLAFDLLTMPTLRNSSLLSGFILAAASLSYAQGADPCAAIAGQSFVVPAKALACLKSFPFNETLRQNILTVVSRVFDFYTFENYYLDAIPPFQDSTVNIRAELARINNTEYAVGPGPL